MGKKKVSIYRRNWRTGGDQGDREAQFGITRLRNDMDYYCCLGFIVAQTRPDLHILDIADPEGCSADIEGLTCDVAGHWRNTALAWDAIQINDEPAITNAQRERQLLELFQDSPYELEFVGEYHVRKD